MWDREWFTIITLDTPNHMVSPIMCFFFVSPKNTKCEKKLCIARLCSMLNGYRINILIRSQLKKNWKYFLPHNAKADTVCRMACHCHWMEHVVTLTCQCNVKSKRKPSTQCVIGCRYAGCLLALAECCVLEFESNTKQLYRFVCVAGMGGRRAVQSV